MESLNIFVFLAIGIAALGIQLRQREKLKDILIYLFTIAVTLLMAKGLGETSYTDTLNYTLIALISLAFLLAQVKKIRENKWVWILPLVLALIPALLGSKDFAYNDYVFSFDGPVIALILLGALIDLIATFKSNFIAKYLGISNEHELKNAISIFLIGFATFLGAFFASHYGIFLVAIGIIVSGFFRQEANRNQAIAVMLIALSLYFLNLVGLESVDLTFGKALGGIFFGVSAVFLLHVGSSSKKRPFLGLIGTLAIGLLVLFCLLFLVTQKTDFGGTDAFVASFVGIAIALVMLPRFQNAEMLASFVIAGGLLLSPMTVNQEELAMTTISVSNLENASKTDEVVESPFEMKGISLDSIKGKYIINEKTVQLNFQLGPKAGITKGAIKSFSGNILIAEDVQKSKFNIVLPVSHLTTFNKYRDESLVEKEYFHVDLYPEMFYDAVKLEPKEDHYVVKGYFKMLGVSKPLDVELKYIGMVESDNEKVPVLVGRASIDRTQFGMKPDSKEGNIVDFEFKIELVRVK